MAHSDRRRFLRVAGSLPAALAVPGGALLAGTAQAGGTHLQRQHFAPLLDQVFDACGEKAGAGTVRKLRLVALEPLPHCADANESFRAVFESVDGASAAQDLWQVSHPALGSHAIFMSPNDAAGQQIEAVFNRG